MIKQFVKLVKVISVSTLCPQLRFYIQAVKECATFQQLDNGLWQQRSKHKLHSAAPAGTMTFTGRQTGVIQSAVHFCRAGWEEPYLSQKRSWGPGPVSTGAKPGSWWEVLGYWFLPWMPEEVIRLQWAASLLTLTTALSALPNENRHPEYVLMSQKLNSRFLLKSTDSITHGIILKMCNFIVLNKSTGKKKVFFGLLAKKHYCIQTIFILSGNKYE